MKKELDQQLCKKYPLLFKNRNASMMETLMCWGFEHGDGWYNIINALCNNMQSHIDWSHKQNAWDLKWNQEHPDEQRPIREPVAQVVVIQVKEKFGSLRFYYMTQTGVYPPRFVLFCNDPKKVHFSIRRRLENDLRERFGLGAAPIRLSFRARRE